jgi:L,D-transpeptidase ErfK/SrfK
MLSRAFAVASCLSLAALLSAGQSAALELPLPPEGDDIVGQVQVIKAKYEDTFAALSEKYDLGYLELVAANPGVDPWLPGEGTDVILPTRFILPPGPREGIVINLAEYRMYFYPADKPVVHTFPLGIGREGWNSPVGKTRISAMTPNPAWYPPKSIREEHAADGDPLPLVVPPGPDNPLGPFKMSLSLPGYLIHGSNKKFGIGMRVSHGCFRMLNHNVLQLAKLAKVGTEVRIIDQPYKFGVSGGKLYLEAHAPLEEDETKKLTVMDKHAVVVNSLLQRDEAAAGMLQLDWEVVRGIIEGEDGLPIQIADQRQALATAHEEPIF